MSCSRLRKMENIIKKAIEGGWIKSPYSFQFKEILGDNSRGYTVVIRFIMDKGMPSDSFYHLEWILMQASFWQALSKSCNWAERICFACGCYMVTTISDQEGLWTCSSSRCRKIDGRLGWHHHAMAFHSINLTDSWENAVKYLEEITE